MSKYAKRSMANDIAKVKKQDFVPHNGNECLSYDERYGNFEEVFHG